MIDVQRERQRNFQSQLSKHSLQAGGETDGFANDSLNSTNFLIGHHGDEVSSKLRAFQRTRTELMMMQTQGTS